MKKDDDTWIVIVGMVVGFAVVWGVNYFFDLIVGFIVISILGIISIFCSLL